MYYSLTIISLIEVVLVLVPALVGIAYVTIAERKTMASMQRRLGPNQVGQNNALTMQHTKSYINNSLINYTNPLLIRKFHTSNYYFSNNKNILDSLLDSRFAPVIPFTHPVLITCDDILVLRVNNKKGIF